MNPEIFNMLFNPQTLAGPGFGQLLASNPDQAATALAQAGVEPPNLSGGGTEMPFAMPQQRPTLAGGTQLGANEANSFYNAVGIPAKADFMAPPMWPGQSPMEARAQAGAPTGADPEAAGGAAAGGMNPASIAQMLSGVKAPAAPTPQKVSTPSLPAASAIPTSPIAALLQMMQPEAPKVPQPYRLNQAIGGR